MDSIPCCHEDIFETTLLCSPAHSPEERQNVKSPKWAAFRASKRPAVAKAAHALHTMQHCFTHAGDVSDARPRPLIDIMSVSCALVRDVSEHPSIRRSTVSLVLATFQTLTHVHSSISCPFHVRWFATSQTFTRFFADPS